MIFLDVRPMGDAGAVFAHLVPVAASGSPRAGLGLRLKSRSRHAGNAAQAFSAPLSISGSAVALSQPALA